MNNQYNKLEFNKPFFRGWTYDVKSTKNTYKVEFEHGNQKGFFEVAIDFKTGEFDILLLRLKGVRRKIDKETIASERNKIRAMDNLLPVIIKGRKATIDYFKKKDAKNSASQVISNIIKSN